MVPKVQVPMDFGVKYLGSPSHGNLKFRLQEGGEIPANSMIISYNSPVIESLTTDLMQTSIDVDDFSKDAVRCFLESCYSGDLRKITKTNFRDANKMSNVFDVSWLIKRCCEFFEKLVNELNAESFDDQHYLFEEAMYMWVTLKNKNFVEIVIKKFSSEIVKCDQFFVPRYLNDLSSRTARELDVVIEIVGKQKHVVMEVLVVDIGENSECISANSRYLLENVSFTDCYPTHKLLYKKMLDNIRSITSPSKEDFGLMLKLFERSDESLSRSRLAVKYAAIPNYKSLKFRHIKDSPDLNQLVDVLISFPLVNNSFIFYDAVHFWLCENPHMGKIAGSTSFIQKFVGVFLERGWKPLAPEYLRRVNMKPLTKLNAELNKITAFSSYKNYSRVSSVDDYSPQDLFQLDKDVKFFFNHPNNDKCDDGENCGFILRVTGLREDVDDSFDLKVVIDPESYPNDIHFHDQCVNVANMHAAFQIDKYKYYDFPISWAGKPYRDGSKKHFIWGPHQLFSDQEGDLIADGDFKSFFTYASNVRMRLVVYHFD